MMVSPAPSRVRASLPLPSPKAIEEVVAKHEAAKQATSELTKSVAASREGLARVKKDNNNIKDRLATAQAALNRAEVGARQMGSLCAFAVYSCCRGGGGRWVLCDADRASLSRHGGVIAPGMPTVAGLG